MLSGSNTSQSLATHEVAIYRGFTGNLRVASGGWSRNISIPGYDHT